MAQHRMVLALAVGKCAVVTLCSTVFTKYIFLVLKRELPLAVNSLGWLHIGKVFGG